MLYLLFVDMICCVELKRRYKLLPFSRFNIQIVFLLARFTAAVEEKRVLEAKHFIPRYLCLLLLDAKQMQDFLQQNNNLCARLEHSSLGDCLALLPAPEYRRHSPLAHFELINLDL